MEHSNERNFLSIASLHNQWRAFALFKMEPAAVTSLERC
jgi:hypothetical protein